MQLVPKRDNFVSPDEDRICEVKCFESRLKENMPRRYHKDATRLLFNATRTHRNRLGIFVQEFGLAYEDSRVDRTR